MVVGLQRLRARLRSEGRQAAAQPQVDLICTLLV